MTSPKQTSNANASTKKASEYKDVWFRGLTPKDKEDLQNALRYSPAILKLYEIVSSFLTEVEVPSRKDYDNPNWAYKQAHYNGEIQAYTKILDILRPKE